MSKGDYQRYEIDTAETKDVVKVPSRFKVRVKRHKLLWMLIEELFHFRGNTEVVFSRPCMYGVFGRKVGGMAPIQDKCVGCLRCTMQYPGVVQIHRNPARASLGDSFLDQDRVDTILSEAQTGRVPVRGAGYRGEFGGEGWDGMWLDMSEIVRPTRDGIHGREFVSTSVDIGWKPMFLAFDEQGRVISEPPQVFQIQVPFMFDPAPSGAPKKVLHAFADAAEDVDSLAIFRLGDLVHDATLEGPHIVPLIDASSGLNGLADLHWHPRMIELDGYGPQEAARASNALDQVTVAVRVPADADPVPFARAGISVIHLVADLHGRGADGARGPFMLDMIQTAHQRLVDAGIREQVTLLGGGGIVLAEHVAKAIVCGLDAVSVDSASWIALQARFSGEVRARDQVQAHFPGFAMDWGTARLRNLAGCWRDQLLEILGAMGLREVRRLRGETGRCMFQRTLEDEAFGEIDGYVST